MKHTMYNIRFDYSASFQQHTSQINCMIMVHYALDHLHTFEVWTAGADSNITVWNIQSDYTPIKKTQFSFPGSDILCLQRVSENEIWAGCSQGSIWRFSIPDYALIQSSPLLQSDDLSFETEFRRWPVTSIASRFQASSIGSSRLLHVWTSSLESSISCWIPTMQ